MRQTFFISLALLATFCVAWPAAASNEPCPSGYNVWTFHHGQTPYTYNCNSTNANRDAAYAFAEAQCEDAWDDVAHLVSHNGGYQINLSDGAVPATWPPTYRWYYSCYTCIQGHPPAWADHVVHELAPIGITEAVHIAQRLVQGVVVDVNLHRIGDDGDDSDLGNNSGKNLYYVNIVEDNVMLQVTVDAQTGEAAVQRDIDPATCR